MAFMLAGTIITKVLVLASFVVLGRELSQPDFGLYALALGVMMFLLTFVNGGVREVLIQRGREWDTLAGPCFWLTFVINSLVALLVGGVGEIVARVYAAEGKIDDPRALANILWTVAASLPVGAVGAILSVRLNIDLRFRATALLNTITTSVRFGLQIGLALAGFGVMSLAIPFIAFSALDALIAWFLTRQSPWRHSPRFDLWPSLLAQSAWMVLAQVCNGIANYGYLIVAGWYLPKDQMGIYYWSLQLAMQVETTLVNNLVLVVFPVLSKFHDDKPRQAAAALRVARATQFVVTLLAMGLALTFPFLETVAWGGKWADAAWPLAILAAFYPLRALFACVSIPVLQAAGRFRDCFAAWLIVALAALAASRVAPDLSATPQSLAWAVGAAGGFVCLALTFRALRSIDAPAATVLATTLSAPALGVAAAAGVWALDTSLISPRLTGAPVPVAVARFVISGALFTLAYVAAVRVLMPRYLADALAVLPARLREPALRVLRLTRY